MPGPISNLRGILLANLQMLCMGRNANQTPTYKCLARVHTFFTHSQLFFRDSSFIRAISSFKMHTFSLWLLMASARVLATAPPLSRLDLNSTSQANATAPLIPGRYIVEFLSVSSYSPPSAYPSSFGCCLQQSRAWIRSKQRMNLPAQAFKF